MCLLACQVAACSSDLEQQDTFFQEAGESITVTATTQMPQSDPSTRVVFHKEDNKLKIAWRLLTDPKGPETFSVYSTIERCFPSTFTMQSMDGDKATFTGEITPTAKAKYYAIYPAQSTDIRTSAIQIQLNMEGQKGDAPDESKMYMYANCHYRPDSNNKSFLFSFHSLTSILKATLKFPAELAGMKTSNVTFQADNMHITGVANITQLYVLPESTGDPEPAVLSNEFTLNEKAEITAYLHLLPETLKNFRVTATVNDINYIGTVSTRVPIDRNNVYTKTVEMTKTQFTVNITPGDGYNYDGLELQIGTFDTDPLRSSTQKLFATGTIANNQATFDVPAALPGNTKLWICIPRVAKFFHTLTFDEANNMSLTLPHKDLGSTLDATSLVGDKAYQNDWVVALYMGVNKDGATGSDATPLYWATGNLIATKTEKPYKYITFHIATMQEMKLEATTDEYTSPSGAKDNARNGYEACALGAQWDKFGFADNSGLKTYRDNNSYRFFGDYESICGTDLDIARQQLGDSWRLPTGGENQDNELAVFANTSYTNPSLEGSDWKDGDIYLGRKYIYKASDVGTPGNTLCNTLFFPAASYRLGIGRSYYGYGYYWSGTNYPLRLQAYNFSFQKGYANRQTNDYLYGHTVRPVTE